MSNGGGMITSTGMGRFKSPTRDAMTREMQSACDANAEHYKSLPPAPQPERKFQGSGE